MNLVKCWFRLCLFLCVTGAYSAWVVSRQAHGEGLHAKAGLWTVVTFLSGLGALGNVGLLFLRDDEK